MSVQEECPLLALMPDVSSSHPMLFSCFPRRRQTLERENREIPLLISWIGETWDSETRGLGVRVKPLGRQDVAHPLS